MSVEDLSKPLGMVREAARGVRLPRIGALPVVTAALGAAVAGIVVWAALVDDPLGGEPRARVPISGTAPEPRKPAGGETALPGTGPAPVAEAPPGGPTVTVIDGMSGKTQQVSVGQPAGSGADPRLIERSRHGSIPKIAADGARPADVYARPGRVQGAVKPNVPRIAIVVGGLGISASGTSEAIAKLPGEVTLAFAPYGADLDRVVARARGDGHEIVLQVPMEPFDYPENDPGPQTLLTGLTAEQNVDRLHWFLSRFGGYVGVANYMGARFTSTEGAISPLLREITRRGLIFLDDGSSPRSAARELAGGLGTSFALADIVLDTVPSPAEVDAALARLERVASERGVAVGFATGLPVSLERIARWAKDAEGRGYTLVPISAVASRARGPG